MREILFRGKSVNDGQQWVEGSLVITTIEPADDTPIKHYHIEDMTIGVFPNEFQSGLTETVDPESICEFTGMTDKNGKKIFEGDIIKWDAKEWGAEYCEPVVWDYSFLGVRQNDWKEFCEVIGNIHDNPELLGGDWE